MLELGALRERLRRWRERANGAGDDRQRADCESIARQYEALIEIVEGSSRLPRTPA